MVKHLVSFDDLSVETIKNIFKLANVYDAKLRAKEPIDLCKDKIMTTMFYEPSTRTRMSFESAMLRLGGKIISSADTKTSSSAAKGESLIDTIKVIQHYADIVVLRHFNDGSTMLAAENSDVPIISGGDGAHEHPTQTLCDLYTILKEKKGEIKGLNVALCGDLRYGRTVHSLAYGLAKFGANIWTIAPEGFQLPEYVEHRIKSEYGIRVERYRQLDDQIKQTDIVYVTTDPEKLFHISIELFDAVYVTRIQKERIKEMQNITENNVSRFISKELLGKAKHDTIVMHPLPRRNELPYDIDQDKRAAYFRQAAYGVPIRMALIAAMLGLADFRFKTEKRTIKTEKKLSKCRNENCITNNQENIENKFLKANGLENFYRCYYCDEEQEIASENKKFGISPS